MNVRLSHFIIASQFVIIIYLLHDTIHNTQVQINETDEFDGFQFHHINEDVGAIKSQQPKSIQYTMDAKKRNIRIFLNCKTTLI